MRTPTYLHIRPVPRDRAPADGVAAEAEALALSAIHVERQALTLPPGSELRGEMLDDAGHMMARARLRGWREQRGAA